MKAYFSREAKDSLDFHFDDFHEKNVKMSDFHNFRINSDWSDLFFARAFQVLNDSLISVSRSSRSDILRLLKLESNLYQSQMSALVNLELDSEKSKKWNSQKILDLCGQTGANFRVLLVSGELCPASWTFEISQKLDFFSRVKSETNYSYFDGNVLHFNTIPIILSSFHHQQS